MESEVENSREYNRQVSKKLLKKFYLHIVWKLMLSPGQGMEAMQDYYCL